MKKSYAFVGVVGLVMGLAAVYLTRMGNPPNMGFCIACFERDIAGAIGLHQAKATQYIRPEIIAIVLGALVAALAFREFRPSSGSAPAIRFTMGSFSMVGALVFLGCPLRMTIRLGGGGLNALVGLLGFVTGIWVGTLFLRKGFDLGPTRKSTAAESLILPGVMVALLALLLLKPVFNPDAGGPIFFTKTEPGVTPIPPGAAVAPVALALAAGLLVGFLAQRTSFCTVGGFRDFILFREMYLLAGWVGVLVAVFLGDLAFGFFEPGFVGQPIARSTHLWNFLGLALVGLNGVLLGGCPLRQLILAANGNGDSALYVLGMIVGAGVAHNFMLAANPKAPVPVSPYGQVMVLVGIAFALVVGYVGMKNAES